MSFNDSIQQLRNEQLARQSDSERFISVKSLFEQLKQLYSDQSYNALCLLALKKYRSAKVQPSLHWFSNGRWSDIPPVAFFQLLDKHGAPNIGAPDYYPNAEAALRAVSDDVMNTDKLADCGFLRTEIADALGVPLDTARPEALMFEQKTLDLKAENLSLKEKIEALEKRLAAPIEKAETYAAKREEFFIAVIASLYDKNRLTSAKDLLPKASELLRLVENKIPLFWPAEGCFPMSEEKCLKILREAISLLERDVTDLHQLRVEKRQMQKTRKLNLLNQ
ncbi:hypothetical protein [Pantoea sp. Ae16]|uniref:hypothetical protein n=1 Tax=Pantoea sp. Ae16 TaxID=1890373 RepID=UPI0008FCE207|nr:hypothetical protein [Pantoea sp. Ae16]OIX91390.1 hypothetical protein BFS13_08710 [Pantoea sp. Ae16]